MSALIGAVPGVLAIVALALVLFVYRAEVRRLLPRVAGVEAFGLKVSLIDVKDWAAGANRGRNLGVTDRDLRSALDRGASASAAYRGAKILWIDDHPENNIWERRALSALGAELTVAISNAEGYDRLRRSEFDVLISDMARDNQEDAREIPRSFAGRAYRPDVVYYVLRKDERPVPEAAGITTRPDELVDLVTDMLERRLYRHPSDLAPR